ncbi:Kef-type K+ transport system, membrane componentfused TrkA K+ transport system [Halapricum desulfuricans]|uniref:Kef-type K+ transport system, membrane componentfused TrkA K+ transport system n=2 Tax=Halapricum desulfuricans TaxID=2841257 RepID=A0A897NE18_9EURY|nr:cation:proton antiporter [Halapricum desulfuricans]QSG10927.1 Kef-type K+ transport system, membrane componentfused TrkA K+ transport system [Halapricum desulfuricans]
MASLLEVGLMFASIAAVGWLADRLGQSVIPFYIVIGMVASEFVVGRLDLPAELWGVALPAEIYVTETEFIELGAELGIVFLLFFLGLEFNLDRLLARRTQIGSAGTIDFLINFPAGLALGWLFFGSALPAFLVAGIVYISSSAIITKSLIDLGWIANDEAEPILGTLVYEDLLIAVYLAVAGALVLGGGDPTQAARSVGVALAFLVVLVVAVQFGTPAFERLFATDSHEFIVLRAVGLAVLVAGMALALGVSEAVAAFFVGMALASTGHVQQIEELLEPLRDLFAAVFFFWIGLVTDPLAVAGAAGLIAVAVLATTPTKVLSGYLGGRAFDLDARRSARTALAMTTRGEFSLIIATLAVSGVAAGTISGPVGERIGGFAVGYVLAMAVIGTTLMQYSGPFETAVQARFGESSTEQ